MKKADIQARFQPLPWGSLQKNQFFTLQEVANFSHISPNTLRKHHKPKVKIGKRYFYTFTDIRQIAATIPRYSSPHAARREAGYLSKMEVARETGVSITCIKWWLDKGVVPEPSHVFPGCQDFYWHPKEVNKIILFFKKRAKSYQSWLASKRVFGWQQEKRI
jgi:hypothetical protein